MEIDQTIEALATERLSRIKELSDNIRMTQEKPTEQEIMLERDLARWKRVAAYLASCHAATLEGAPNRTSKSERERFVSICQKAVGFLNGEQDPPMPWISDEKTAINNAIRRCEQAARDYKDRRD